jgi:hypothetical protein
MKNYIKNKLLDNIDSNNLLNILLAISTLAIFFIIVVFCFYFFRFSNWHLIPSGSQEVWGQFGDFIGGTLNPLLSFFGLIALLVTIALQSKELELSRKELKLTRKELKKSAAAQNEIKNTQIRQKFESTFFALLNQHNQILEKLPKDDIIEKLVPETDIKVTSNPPPKKFDTLKSVNAEFKEKYKLHGHYFRVLYQLLKFIALNIPESKIHSLDKDTQPFTPSTDEKMYSNMVRAFLSSEVVLLLAMNCYCSKGDDDIYWVYKWLVEHYAFFEHLPLDDKTSQRREEFLSEIKEYYDKSAFGNNESFVN